MSRGIQSMIAAAGRVDLASIKSRRPIVLGKVYIVGFGPYVKIGFSAMGNFDGRLKTMATYAPEPLVVHATFDGSRALERMFHRWFAELRLQGEWFRREGALAEWIEAGTPRYPRQVPRQTQRGTVGTEESQGNEKA